MIRVMIVDDEPYIAQGLKILIDWQQECCQIVYTAANGKEALDYLRKQDVDLILLDMQMPEMTGLEFLQKVKEENISSAKVLILSGYNDFYYAQKAIQYQCKGYLLKPIQKEQLLEYLTLIRDELETSRKEEAAINQLEHGYLEQVLGSILRNVFTEEQKDYVNHQMQIDGEVRYVHISLNSIAELEEMMDDEIAKLRKKVYDSVCEFLGEDSIRCEEQLLEYEESYQIALIYSENLAAKRGMSEEEFFASLLSFIKEKVSFDVIILIGKAVESIEKLSYTYVSACTLQSARSVYGKKDIYYYEKDVQANEGKIVLCKKSLDSLLKAIQEHDEAEIPKGVDNFFKEMEQLGSSDKVMSMNLNYLMFQMVHLAIERDESVNQEEVMNYIGEITIDSSMDPGSRVYMKQFASSFSEYLIQLQKNHSVGVLAQIEQEIKENYSQNLTLRELGKKYFINSSYLGQMFRKKYGQSFKDYLCNYRINEAAVQLIRTDKKVSDISEEVGYHDVDYFISKFIEYKGCTPARYRKSNTPT